MDGLIIPPLPPGWRPGQYTERLDQLRRLPRRVNVVLAADVAASVLPVFEGRIPDDRRPRMAVAAAADWALAPSPAAFAAAAVAARGAAEAADEPGAFGEPVAAADAAYAAATAVGAIDAAGGAASSAAEAVGLAAGRKWLWCHTTYLHARGPSEVGFRSAWRTVTAVNLARSIVVGNDLARLPVLADALEEAGFGDPYLLAHLRTDRGEWTRADWVLWNLLRMDTDEPV